MTTDYFKVAIRLRPLATQVSKKGVVVKHNECWLTSKPKIIYKFDTCFDEHEDQDTIYERFTKPLISSVMDGYNCCLLAYGQTGSGKTYTMTGNKSRYGIIQQLCRDITSSQSNNLQLMVSYYEIYKEEITDLLTGISGLKIREDPINGVFVSKIRTENVITYEDLLRWVNIGRRKRKTMSTLMNKDSSRSHSIITIYLYKGNVVTKLNLVDLAGSESMYRSQLTSSARASESIKINLSLLTLHKVISTLAKKNSTFIVPYRDSKLTFALKDSLSRNSRTYMIATINPSIEYNTETIQTLNYSSLARTIESRPRCILAPKLPISMPSISVDVPLKLFESYSTINLPSHQVDLMETSVVSHVFAPEAMMLDASSNVFNASDASMQRELEVSKRVIEELQSTICRLTANTPNLAPMTISTQHILIENPLDRHKPSINKTKPKPSSKPAKPKPKKLTASQQRRFKLVY